MAIDTYNIQQLLQDALAQQDTSGGGGMDTSGISRDQDPYQARVDELIRTLSEPDNPELLPTQGQPSKTQGVLAFLGDALSNVGAAKAREPLPGNRYQPALQARRNYETAAAAENTRRTQQAGITGKKTGALLSLKDIEAQRKDNADALDKSNAGREMFLRQLYGEAGKHGVNVYKDDGTPRPPDAIQKDIASASSAREKSHQEMMQKRFDLNARKVEIMQQNANSRAKQAAKTPGGGGGSKAASSAMSPELKVTLQQAKDANQKALAAGKNFDSEAEAKWNGIYEDLMAQAKDLATPNTAGPAATAAPAPAPVAPAAKPTTPYEAYSARDWASWSEATRAAFVKKYGKKPVGVQ